MARRRKEKKAAVQQQRRRPKSQALPGLEDHAIKPLEEVAEHYAEIRDQRMELTEREHTLKVHALKLMKKYDKTIYRHNGVEITVVPGEDDVKVRVKKGGDDDVDTDDAADDAGEPTADAGDTAAIADVHQTAERRAAVDEES
jgi:hypothetical protein